MLNRTIAIIYTLYNRKGQGDEKLIIIEGLDKKIILRTSIHTSPWCCHCNLVYVCQAYHLTVHLQYVVVILVHKINLAFMQYNPLSATLISTKLIVTVALILEG